jgi:transcriptional regulator with XRE-family HTH domain
MSDIAANLTSRREAVGLSKSALARKARVGRATVQRLESGATEWSIGTIRKLAVALGVHEDVLLAPVLPAKRASGGGR